MEDQAKQHQKWWQKNKQLLIRTGIVIIVVFAFFALLVYIFGWDWTGFSHKTLWDWLNLIGVLAIPVIAGFGVAWFTQLQQQRDKRLEQTQHEHDQKLADQRAA